MRVKNLFCLFQKGEAQFLYSRLQNVTTDCLVPARLVYLSQYYDQKVRHVVYSAQYVFLKSKLGMTVRGRYDTQGCDVILFHEFTL